MKLTLKSLKAFHPRKESVLAWDVIVKAKEEKAFCRLMNKWYPNGITFDDVNDQLQFEFESVFAELDI